MRIARPLLALAILSLATPYAAAGPSDILGTWRGTSLCANTGENSACKDEQVQYDFAVSPADKSAVALDAKKLVDGKYESMGELVFRYDEATHLWTSTFKTRSGRELVWSFAVSGDTLTGTGVLLPDTVVRNVNVKRVP